METLENVDNRYTDPITGKFIEGNPGGGRPPVTEEQKLVKKAVKELVKEYQETLAEILPELSPVLKAKALEGDMQAMKELHDRVMGKAPQDFTSGGEKIQQIPIYASRSVQGHHSDSKDIQPPQEA